MSDQFGKVYVGSRTNGHCSVSVFEDGKSYLLPLCQDIRNHSPAGFEWGHGGCGPVQLALALCCDFLGDSTVSQEIYQRFALRLMGRLDRNAWRMTGAELWSLLSEFVCDLRRANPFGEN